MYIFLKCVKYHHCRTLQISMLLLYSHGSIYTINDYSSHSNYELFGIPLFVGPFSQGFSALFAPNPLYVLLGSSYHCKAFLFACSHSNITHLLLTGVKIVVKDILKLFQVLRCSSIKRNDRHVHLNNQIIAKKATNNTFHTASVFFGTCREDTTGLLLYSQIFGVIREHAKSEGKKKG